MPKTVFDLHITGPRISVDQLVVALLICLIPLLMWLGLGPAGIAVLEPSDLGASLPVVALTQVAFAVLATYLLAVATGAFEVLVRARRFVFRDFTLLLTIRLGMGAMQYSETTSIVRAFPPEITHGPADAPLIRKRCIQTPRILVHRWLAGTSSQLLFH